MKAGLYTHMNVGAIHVQWVCSNLAKLSLGISLWYAAFPSANSSHCRDSTALRVSRLRTSVRLDDASPSMGSGDWAGVSWTFDVGP
jgi:hypothetical protein